MSTRPRVLPRGTAKPGSRGQHIDYEFSAKALKDGNDLFFTGLRRQTVHKAAKKLSKMVGQEVYAFSMPNGNEWGYGMTTKSRLRKEKRQVGA